MEIFQFIIDFFKIASLVFLLSYFGGKSILFIQDQLVAIFPRAEK